MKPRPTLGLVAIAALAPLAWAGNQAARRKASAAGQSHAHSAAQPSKAGKQNRFAIDSGTRVAARLLTTLNAKKAKPGDRVVAKVTQNVKQHGHMVIRKNSKLIGHIVSAQASGKGSTGSRLEVAFDHLVQGKSSTALNTVVTSIFSLPWPMVPPPMDMGRLAMQPPMSGGGVGSTVGSTVGTAGGMIGSAAGATGRMTAGSMLRNPITVSSNSAAAGHAAAGTSNPLGPARLGTSAGASNQTGATSIFSRRNGNLELHSGTRLQFRVVASAQTRNSAPHR